MLARVRSFGSGFMSLVNQMMAIFLSFGNEPKPFLLSWHCRFMQQPLLSAQLKRWLKRFMDIMSLISFWRTGMFNVVRQSNLRLCSCKMMIRTLVMILLTVCLYFRSELWSFYEGWFGKLSEMSLSDYRLITASNMKTTRKYIN